MRRDRSDALPLAGAAAAIVAVVCCAGVPALGAILGGLRLAGLLGVTGGVLLTAAILALVVVIAHSRRRRECDVTTRRPRR